MLLFFGAGYVQTPGWDGQTVYPSYMDSRARVDVPDTQWIMVSVTIDVEESFGCRKDRLTLRKGNATSMGEEITTFCIKQCPQLVQTKALHVHFVSAERASGGIPKTGFRLYFSFHKPSALLQEVEACKWNCSVAFWSDFRRHFPCNVVSECVGHEDEADCPYTSESCGAGFFSAGGSCFVYHIYNQWPMTREESSSACRKEGKQLASLSTPAKWTDMIKVLQIRLQEESIYIGLTSAAISLPHMLVVSTVFHLSCVCCVFKCCLLARVHVSFYLLSHRLRIIIGFHPLALLACCLVARVYQFLSIYFSIWYLIGRV